MTDNLVWLCYPALINASGEIAAGHARGRLFANAATLHIAGIDRCPNMADVNLLVERKIDLHQSRACKCLASLAPHSPCSRFASGSKQ